MTKVFIMAALGFLLFTSSITTQESGSLNNSPEQEKKITDFYSYVNKAWIDSTNIPDNHSVVNNWGILWDKITEKSVEILSGEKDYDLDNTHDYTLKQLQYFYRSSMNLVNGGNRVQSVRLIQKHYPIVFGIIFSEITTTNLQKDKIQFIVDYLIKAYEIKIRGCDRLSKYDKDLFLSKLSSMKFEFGAPDLNSFPKIPVHENKSLAKNIELAENYQKHKNTLGSITDWQSEPFETHCRYNFHDNKVKLYAGFLFNYAFIKKDEAEILFATLGRTISHEMTHAFDIVGKKFNENGRKIWFKRLFYEAFSGRTHWEDINQSLVIQFNHYSIHGLSVNGKNTLQENFADLGGLENSLFALELYLSDNPAQYPLESRRIITRKFLISCAQFWREKTTPEYERSSLSGLHSPQKFRAIGPLYNSDELYLCFNIDEKSKYYIPKEQRIKIW